MSNIQEAMQLLDLPLEAVVRTTVTVHMSLVFGTPKMEGLSSLKMQNRLINWDMIPIQHLYYL